MKTVFLLLIVTSLAWGAWQRSGDSVIDTASKLQWQDDKDAQRRDTVWRDAKKFCAALDLEGFNDWRLPTRGELEGLVKANLAGAVILENTAMSAYWTSEINRKMPINAWAVYWGNGHMFDTDRCDEAHVRCVRNR
jgi:hypothetical protein